MTIDTTIALPDGPRLRVRLPHTSERSGLRALLTRLGVAADELELARALRFDPRRRTIACATAWVDGSERIVAWAAMDAGASTPDLMLADEERAPGVGAVLAGALRERSIRRAA